MEGLARHAVRAAEVAAVHHRDAQVAHRAGRPSRGLEHGAATAPPPVAATMVVVAVHQRQTRVTNPLDRSFGPGGSSTNPSVPGEVKSRPSRWSSPGAPRRGPSRPRAAAHRHEVRSGAGPRTGAASASHLHRGCRPRPHRRVQRRHDVARQADQRRDRVAGQREHRRALVGPMPNHIGLPGRCAILWNTSLHAELRRAREVEAAPSRRRRRIGMSWVSRCTRKRRRSALGVVGRWSSATRSRWRSAVTMP